MKSNKKTEKTNVSNNRKSQETTYVNSGAQLFYKRDIAVYLALFVLIISLFSIFVFPAVSDKNSNDGFTVTMSGKTVVNFNSKSSSPFTISPEFSEQVEIDFSQQADDVYTVKIYSLPDKNGYNVLLFNAKEVSVKVTESTCSDSKDCVHFPTLTTSGSIYCAPHSLKITPTGGSGYVPPTTG